MEDISTAVAAALDQVPDRLRRLRTRRGVTLTALAATTGISKSTLSRLETGQRRPTLELLLELSRAYRVPLDDLVGAPEVGDPRIRLKPGRVKGRTVIPLTRQPDGMQAWKIVIPISKVDPEPRAHDGYEWIYVLSGHVRLVLGGDDWVLGPGEVAEFETTVPHWFGSTGREPAEILSIFGRPGERMNVRTRPAAPEPSAVAATPSAAATSVRIRIEGHDLPGRRCGPSPDRPEGYANIHVGVQRRNDPREWLELQPGDAKSVAWEFDATATERDGSIDLRGPYLQGGPGGRFVYLSWGTLSSTGEFEMFRRAKLTIADIDDAVLRAAVRSGGLVGRLGLTDAKGNPSCARRSDVEWSVRPAAAP